MPTPSRVARISLILLTALTVAPTPPGAMARSPVRDEDPSPEVCQRLGFESYGEDRRAMSRVGAVSVMAGRQAYASSPQALVAPPPPPPSPVPSVEHRLQDSSWSRVEELSVSGAKARPGMPMPPAYRPLPRDTERYPQTVQNPVKRVAEEPVSTFSIDVDTAAYANVRRFLNDGSKPPRDAVRVEELVNYFDYGYAAPTDRAVPFQPFVAVTPSPWSSERQIVQIGLQGYEPPAAAQPPLNLVFLIDTSGSMAGEDRLPLARKALNILIDQLGPQDRVSMVAYAGSAGAVLAPTTGRDKLKMRCALGALQSGGSTAGGQGLALAYALAQQNFDRRAVNRVILLTDGDFNVGVADPAKLKDFVAEKRKTGVYLSVYGFGRGNYNDTMMQTLAQNGNGTASYIDTLSEARKVFRDDFAASVFPIADDVKIQVEFNPAKVSEYRLIGYETRMLNREDFNNDQVDAGEVGAGASVTALYEITPMGARPSSDPLRYQRSDGMAERAVMADIAYLKVRYKLPGQGTSRLLERPITPADVYRDVAAAPEPARWALAVAGFGQKLRGDPWVDERFGWREIASLAQGARGADSFGLRAEFVQLVRGAGDTRSVNE